MRKWTMIYEEMTDIQPLEIVQKQKDTALQGYSHNLMATAIFNNMEALKTH
jgi:hypothetical protein